MELFLMLFVTIFGWMLVGILLSEESVYQSDMKRRRHMRELNLSWLSSTTAPKTPRT